MTEKKTVIINFTNPEARMKLTVKGKNAIDQAIKISKAFDEACKEIRKEIPQNKVEDILKDYY